MKARFRPVPILLWFAATGVQARVGFHPPHLHPKLTSGKTVVRRVVILPPQILFDRVGMKGPESMAEQGDQLSATLYGAFEKELASRGVEVLPNPMKSAAGDEARYAIANLQSRYDTVRVQLRKKQFRVEDGHLTMGDEIAAFEPAKGADAVVFIRGSGTQATRAKQASILLGFGAFSSFQSDTALVDARTGDVLAWIRMNLLGDVSKAHEDRLDHSLHQALRDIPLGSGK